MNAPDSQLPGPDDGGLGSTDDGGFLDIKTEEWQYAAVVAANESSGHIYAMDDEGAVAFTRDVVPAQ